MMMILRRAQLAWSHFKQRERKLTIPESNDSQCFENHKVGETRQIQSLGQRACEWLIYDIKINNTSLAKDAMTSTVNSDYPGDLAIFEFELVLDVNGVQLSEYLCWQSPLYSWRRSFGMRNQRIFTTSAKSITWSKSLFEHTTYTWNLICPITARVWDDILLENFINMLVYCVYFIGCNSLRLTESRLSRDSELEANTLRSL
jgi:hypothetical protein